MPRVALSAGSLPPRIQDIQCRTCVVHWSAVLSRSVLESLRRNKVRGTPRQGCKRTKKSSMQEFEAKINSQAWLCRARIESMAD